MSSIDAVHGVTAGFGAAYTEAAGLYMASITTITNTTGVSTISVMDAAGGGMTKKSRLTWKDHV